MLYFSLYGPVLSPWYQLHLPDSLRRKVGKVQDCMTLNKSAPKGCYFMTHAVSFLVTKYNPYDIPCPKRLRGQRSIVPSVSQGTELSRYWLAQHYCFQVYSILFQREISIFKWLCCYFLRFISSALLNLLFWIWSFNFPDSTNNLVAVILQQCARVLLKRNVITN